jgi:hypothetical protein
MVVSLSPPVFRIKVVAVSYQCLAPRIRLQSQDSPWVDKVALRQVSLQLSLSDIILPVFHFLISHPGLMQQARLGKQYQGTQSSPPEE